MFQLQIVMFRVHWLFTQVLQVREIHIVQYIFDSNIYSFVSAMQDIQMENINKRKDQHLQSISFSGVFECVQIRVYIVR